MGLSDDELSNRGAEGLALRGMINLVNWQHEEPNGDLGGWQLSIYGAICMTGDRPARFRERIGVKFPRPTRWRSAMIVPAATWVEKDDEILQLDSLSAGIILPMRIGELAKRAGVSVQAIRYYERRRLMRTPRRTAAGYRVYSEIELEIVTVIKKMQRFGFKLVEIRRVLQLWILPSDTGASSPYQHGSQECLRQALQLGEKKLETMNEQIRASIQLREELEETLRQIRRGLDAQPIPVETAASKLRVAKAR